MLVENELNKLRVFDLSYFGGKNYFVGDDGTQIYLVFQLMNKFFKNIISVGDGEYSCFWKSKGLFDERINSTTACNYNITPELIYLGANIRVKFIGSYGAIEHSWSNSKHIHCL